MIDIDKLARMLKDIFAEGYRSGHADAKSGNQPTKLSAGTHAEILAMAEASNKQHDTKEL